MALRKCACIDTLYTELDWLDRFQAAKNDGFEAVEFWDWRIRDLDATREAAEKAGIAISGFNGDADYSLVDPTHKQKYLDYLKESIAAAKKVGAASVTIHSNALGDGGIVVNHYDNLSHTVKLCSMYDTLLACAELAEKEEIKVSADDVKERLNEMAERNARLVSVDRKAKKGDIAVIDFEGFDNGEAFEGGKGENYELELGSGSFVPGFEDQVIGMKAGEEKDLDITFPEDYHKDLAGKKVVFHVKAKEIKCKELPKLDDDFAKDVSEYDTLKELKDSIKREITEQREQSAKYAVENELMEKVAANIECDIPDALIDEQCARFLEEFKQRLQSQGIPYDQYCKMTNMDEAKFLEEGKEPATRQVRMDLAVNAIIKEEKLEATDEEVEKQYNDLAEKYSMDVNELKKYLDAMSVRTQIIRDKAISVVVDSAKIEKKKAPKKEAEGEAAEGEEKPAKKTAAKKSAKKEEEKAE